MGKKRDEQRVREIKAEMMRRGVTTIQIARALGVTRTWVSLVLNERAESPRVRKAIAEALGVKVKDLWPNDNHKRAA
jgi:lambda repressor-like predicted transcriptional regulator